MMPEAWKTACIVGCLAAVLLAAMAGPAHAAVVPFTGTQYSILHLDARGDPAGDWIQEINETITVRTGDSMQFQNRWYNSLPGTADIRISYGGLQPDVCTGADESVYYGLNYGDYYPALSNSTSFYSTVRTSPSDPIRGVAGDTFILAVNHQYVYNGVLIGCDDPDEPWDMRFTNPASDNVSETDTGGQDNAMATDTPAPTIVQNATATPGMSTPTPGFDFSTIMALAGALAIVIGSAGRKRRKV